MTNHTPTRVAMPKRVYFVDLYHPQRVGHKTQTKAQIDIYVQGNKNTKEQHCLLTSAINITGFNFNTSY